MADGFIKIREAKYAIYKFLWKYNHAPKGEETTQPKRVFGVKTVPKAENVSVDQAN